MSQVFPGSIRRRIPAVIGMVLAVGVSVFGVVAYRVVRESAIQAADARLFDAARQLADVFDRSFGTVLENTRGVASDSSVIRVLRDGPQGGGAEESLEALRRLGPVAGSLRRVDLRDSSGNVLASLADGSDVEPPGPEFRAPLQEGGLGRLFRAGDTVYYEIGAPVMAGGEVLGVVATLRSITTTREAARQLANLIGIEAGLLLGNTDGSLWTDLVDTVQGPPAQGSPVVFERDGEARRAALQPIGSYPVQVEVEFSQAEILRRPHALASTFGALAAIIVAVGALAGWLLTRPITGPLVQLADAADSIAAGDLDVSVAVPDREDEIGRLARSFGVMAGNVRASRDTLEHQVAERTEELRDALVRLHHAQEELVRKERLATLGQLSSSVGHELRNPLGVMTNAVYYLNHVLDGSTPKVREYLGILQAQIHLCEKIVADLLDFARVKSPQKARRSVADLVDEQLDRVDVPPSVSVEKSFPGSLPDVEVDPVQIGQVLLNLLTNGVQAMEDSGGTLALDATPENGTVRLRVMDSGEGVSPENRGKIFEPLFTTKARGIGLGLSVSRSLAQANGGDLSLDDGPGRGATFVVTLPVAGEDS